MSGLSLSALCGLSLESGPVRYRGTGMRMASGRPDGETREPECCLLRPEREEGKSEAATSYEYNCRCRRATPPPPGGLLSSASAIFDETLTIDI